MANELQDFLASLEASGTHVMLQHDGLRFVVVTSLPAHGAKLFECRVYRRVGHIAQLDLASPTALFYRCFFPDMTHATRGHRVLQDLLEAYLADRDDWDDPYWNTSPLL